MAKNPNQKLKLLYIKDYLERCSDEEHSVSTADIIAYLDENGISAERKSIYDDIENLKAYGMDIVNTKGRQSGYCLASRDFEVPELKLLVDAVTAAKFLTKKKSEQIVGRIASLTSVHRAKELKRSFYVPSRVRAQNEKVFYNVDAIHSAISSGKMICFKYSEWKLAYDGSRAELAPRRDGKTYEITPCELVWDDEYYYLIGYDGTDDIIKHFRVDKMEKATVSDKDRETAEKVTGFDVSEHVSGIYGMFGGREESVSVQFDNSLIGLVADRYGRDCSIRRCDENSFVLHTKAQISPQFFAFIFGCGDKARILSPQSVIDEYSQVIKGVAALY